MKEYTQNTIITNIYQVKSELFSRKYIVQEETNETFTKHFFGIVLRT